MNACSLSKEKEKNVHIDIKCKKWFDENFVMIPFFSLLFIPNLFAKILFSVISGVVGFI